MNCLESREKNKMLGMEGAIKIAIQNHRGQKDKQGQPYIFHVLRVALKFTQYEYFVPAVLHDIVEDCHYPLSRIEELFGADIANTVDHLTRREDETYSDYIKRCARNPISRKIKIADLEDNLSRVNDLRVIDPEKADSLNKRYMKAMQYIQFVYDKKYAFMNTNTIEYEEEE